MIHLCGLVALLCLHHRASCREVVDLDETSTDDWGNLVPVWAEDSTSAYTPTAHPSAYSEISTQTLKVMEPYETSGMAEQIGVSEEVVTILSDESKGVETTGFPAGLQPVPVEESTEPNPGEANLLPKEFTNKQQTETFAEEETFSDDDNMDATWNFFQPETFPWIRFGLIGGVLLITAVVLCVLGALRVI